MIRFLVIGHSRSGSNLLVRSLNAHPQVLAAGELLKSTQGLEPAFKQLDCSEEEAQRLTRLAEARTAEFTREFHTMAAARGHEAAGFKLFYYHAREPARSSVWDLIDTDPGLHFLHLYRENQFDAFLSRELATASSRWVQRTGAPADDYEATVVVDLAELGRFLKTNERYRDEMLRRLPATRTLTLRYDQLEADFTNTMMRAFEFLAVTPEEIAVPLQKQRKQERWNYVENRREVQDYLSSRGLSRFI